MYYKNITTLTLSLLGTIILLSSCGPVNRFTRVKRIPREHSFNYCGGDIKAPKSDLNKEPWIVFSDREKNQTFNNAGGKVKSKDIDYLDPFLVIGEKGEYLKLIKYTPDILKNGKLEHNKAEYYGWIHKSKLLLNQQSVTDVASGKKNKMITVFGDSIPINEPVKFFTTDSIKLYKDLELKSQVGAILPFSIVYQLKKSDNDAMTLVARKPYINADDASGDILGWIDNSLIKDIGTGLHVNFSSIPSDLKRFLISKNKEVLVTEDLTEASRLLSEQYQTIKYNPVSSYSTMNSLTAFKTRVVLPVFDYSNNFVFNVNGEQISHDKFKAITKELRKINISFVFEGKEQTISQFPQIVNALQNLQPMFEQVDDSYSFHFNCIMTFDETGKLLRPFSTEFTSDYSQLVDFLSDKANSKDKLKPIKLSRTSWSGLRKAVDILDGHQQSANLIVLIGEKGFGNTGVDPSLATKILRNNCRIVGFQVYAEDGDEYNNFVLDIEEMINYYADGMINTKRNILVSPDQIKRSNYYKRVGNIKNSYRLDFPNNSITQGALFFPQKLETLPMEIISNNIDTLVQQIKQDNSNIIRYMSRAFRSVGNNRTRFDSLFVQNYGVNIDRIPNKKLVASFENEAPGWYIPSKVVLLDDIANKSLDYRLMLSEEEMKEMKQFITDLSKIEVDYIINTKKEDNWERKECNCPEDDLFLELEKDNIVYVGDSIVSLDENMKETMGGAYINTKKIRDHLVKMHLNPIKYCKLCKENENNLKSMTLAEAQYRITGSPTSNELLNSIRIKDIKDKKKVTDKMLDDLVSYYKKMKKELDKSERFESNGEVYYWVDRRLLP